MVIPQRQTILLPDFFPQQPIDPPECSGFAQRRRIPLDVDGAPDHAGEAIEAPASFQAQLVQLLGGDVFGVEGNIPEAERGR